MTIWRFDDYMQNTINQVFIIEIVKLPNCHDEIFDDADSSSRGRTKKGRGAYEATMKYRRWSRMTP